eukprot:g10239.t1
MLREASRDEVPFKPRLAEAPNRANSFSDLTIRKNVGGSCLSHKHPLQFLFVSQTLTLWRNIMQSMSLLWHDAEADMLNVGYRLMDTGQGFNRVQQAPRVAETMSKILSSTQQEITQKRGEKWVGLSVVHLGDRDVPNALVFIDKYTQVPKILGPIVKVIEKLPLLYA